jgi:hypothetical protein
VFGVFLSDVWLEEGFVVELDGAAQQLSYRNLRSLALG